MGKIAIVYGSSTGATQIIAEKLQKLLGDADLYNAESLDVDNLNSYPFLIFGTSTTGVGDLQDDWEILLPKIEKIDFSGKKIALFGLGDSASFSSSFAGGMYVIYKALKNKVPIVGSVSTDGYNFDDSEALVDGRFVGLALDEDNEYEKTDERLANWVEALRDYMD